MPQIDPEKIRVILATDCGSTTTKAILIQKIDGVYRQTHRGEAPTTVEAPFADVTMGVINSITEVQELAGRRLINEQGQIIRPAADNEGCDIYISTSSAGGGLQMMVAGVVREMTGESAKRAALGAGAIVMDVIASNDKRRPHEQIRRIRELRPDIILISGGVDGGATTPGGVGNILQTIASKQGINVVGVDIGGATTDVFSVFDGTFNRTVSANLGMSYSIANVCAEAGMPNILRWVHVNMDEGELRNRVKNKMIRPTTIPQTLEALIFEQAVSREALRLAYIQHKEFATTLKGVQQQRTVGDMFRQEISGQTIVDNMKLDLLVASGGVLSHAPRMHQTAMMLIDAFEPEGFTTLAKDSIFMMPHLGVLAQVHPQASLEVFERDCLIYLGTSVAAKGIGKPGRPCFEFSIRSATLNEAGHMMCGDLRLFPLGEAET